MTEDQRRLLEQMREGWRLAERSTGWVLKRSGLVGKGAKTKDIKNLQKLGYINEKMRITKTGLAASAPRPQDVYIPILPMQ